MSTVNLAEMTKRQRVAHRNQQIVEKWANAWVAREAKRFQERYGYDPIKQIEKDGFSLREATRQLREKFKLSEDETTSQVFALTTGLVTLDLSNEYKLVDVVYRKLAKIIPSKKSEESFFPLNRADVPTPIGDNEEAPESGLSGILTRIKNYRFARILSYSNTAASDDQTGEVRDQAGTVGEGMAYAEEQWWVVQLFATYVAANIRGGAGTNPIVPPMNIAGQAPAGYGGPTCTAGDVTQANIENLFMAADFITDALGNFALVQIDAGLFSSARKITVKKILQSVYNPSTPPAGNGVIGGIFSENVLKGEFDAHYTPFIARARQGLDASTPPWALGEAGKFGAFQDREALSVVQEVPNSGKSFSANVTRIKAERRFGAGVNLPEFVIAGN